ncbi:MULTISPECIES: DUF389 domain-containing protein [Spirosoma]|uniref:DUF389 domain-containing protein n=1 Tax=Spirosoma sordidisoli TaxID=2502893 RepID=A0A4Q2UQX2_9BACT|nr:MULTISPECIES: DUF389 domain-containing protein [Spirosoma]RYC71846.1 DUF389 domain-containing protein [Spirosoma sordidisoli]
MHRTFQIQLPADKTTALMADLLQFDEVIGVALYPDNSHKPVGDALSVQLLNRGSDRVLKAIANRCGDAPYLVSTSLTESIIEPDQADKLENDADEAIWEEIETGMRHQGRITPNFVLLMALGGVMATIGIVSAPTRQIMPFVAAAVIAPGFEPLAGIALSVVLRRWQVLWRAIQSSVVGYTTLILTSALTYWFLQTTGEISLTDFTRSEEVYHLANPSTSDTLLSVCGTLAGAIIMSSFRKSVIAGALIAMVIINAAAMIGIGLASGRYDLAGQGLQRFGFDILLILLSCLLVFGSKQRFFHHRRPVA